ncbi:hypothetical protein SE956_24570 [Escherichia coli]|nr:hypothetical protein [Escherichia coli]
MVDLLTEAKSFAAEGTGFTELGGEINAQIKRGDLLYVDVAKAMAQVCWFPVRRMRQKRAFFAIFSKVRRRSCR